jgi:hypothetical protein
LHDKNYFSILGETGGTGEQENRRTGKQENIFLLI